MITPEMLNEATSMWRWLMDSGWIWVVGGVTVIIVIVLAGLVWDAVRGGQVSQGAECVMPSNDSLPASTGRRSSGEHSSGS